MTVSASTLVPGTYVQISDIRAATGAQNLRSILIGQSLTTGTADDEVLTQIFDKVDAQEKFGIGSIIADMAAEWFKNNSQTEISVIALADAGASTAGEQELTVTGTSTAAGTAYLYVNGRLFEVGVASGDTPTIIAAAIAAKINEYPELPISATSAIGVVTTVARNKGTVGNSIDIRFNYSEAQAFPAGVTIAVASSVTGATDIDMDDAIAVIPDEVFGAFVSPYNDATNTGKLVTEAERRFSQTVELEGHVFQAKYDTVTNVIAMADDENSPNQTVIDAGEDNPLPSYLFNAQVAAICALELEIDPARPLQTLEIKGAFADTATNRRNFNEANSLLSNGASTRKVDPAGTVRIERMVTTSLTNSGGSPSTAYQDLNTVFTASYLRQDLKAAVAQQFPRHKLAEDGTTFGVNQKIVTPKSFKAFCVARFGLWQELGLVQDIEGFKEGLTATIDAVNKAKLNVVMPPQFVGQFRIADIALEFTK